MTSIPAPCCKNSNPDVLKPAGKVNPYKYLHLSFLAMTPISAACCASSNPNVLKPTGEVNPPPVFGCALRISGLNNKPSGLEKIRRWYGSCNPVNIKPSRYRRYNPATRKERMYLLTQTLVHVIYIKNLTFIFMHSYQHYVHPI